MLLLFRHSSLLLVAALAAIVTACSNDDSPADKTMRADGKVPVRLRLSVAGEDRASSALTRAPWVDTNATDDEMMNMWVVVGVYAEDDPSTTDVNEADKIVFIHASVPEAAKREIDDLVYLEPGKYKFYSFANIDPSWLNGEGLTSYLKHAKVIYTDGTFSDEFEYPVHFLEIGSSVPATPAGKTSTGVYSIVFDESYNNGKFEPNEQSVTMNGNGFDPTDYDPENYIDNGFGSKGIPMSNYQQLTVTEGNTFDLIVVRMLAKVEVQVYNDGDSDATIESISLTDITANGDYNLKLLPNYGTSPDYPNDMDFHHKDLQPNLGSGATKGNMTYELTTDNEVAATGHKSTGDGQTPVTFKFYVNESVAPIDNASATTGNGSGLFYLTLGIKTGTGEDVVYSHALIDQRGKTETDNGAWHYIARNDYRVIPVILSDWLFRVEPLAFVPIAGYPAVMLSSDAQKATFKTGGPIILQPFVKKRSEANWRDFSDPEVEFVSIHWKNSDGNDQSGAGKIMESPLQYDATSKCIYGVLNNSLEAGLYKTAVTITVKLGPSKGPQYTYSFTCDVILDKRN